ILLGGILRQAGYSPNLRGKQGTELSYAKENTQFRRERTANVRSRTPGPAIPPLSCSGSPIHQEASMAGKVRAIPKDFHTATPYLTVSDAARAIDFYKKAFGAQERMRMAMPNGKIGHAEIQVGDSIIMLADEMQGGPVKSPQSLGGTTGGVF